MIRTFQLLGLLLIGLLSFQAETVSASQSSCRTDADGCTFCPGEDDDCTTWVCPVGHPSGVGIYCDDE